MYLIEVKFDRKNFQKKCGFGVLPDRITTGNRKNHGKTRCCNIAFPRVFSTTKGEKEMRLTTTDLYESGFLHCAGAQLADVWNERNRTSTVVFVFDGDYQLEELQKSYHNGTATVNLADYRRSVETLKDMMFDIIRNANTHKNNKENQNPRRNRNGYQAVRYNQTQQAV